MKYLLLLPSVICISGAIYLLIEKGGSSSGWGWLLFAGFLIGEAVINKLD